ncbi:ATP-dependent sacrificial sulfur transferase LarE [Desulfurivibrio alkaliphilus]|uniref:PP-loop domain protein n=1 Tax=Desulfurivibrio alkaliphilus (strain DSM 19089 / UNIQEM U267 / AHT2) TaxID=589865 RepID=D6Z172_DESAT|nr:ATP-dependent sacrificial sulfur transferase LarE [Desulfurivibrio alkaliphilus]ADH85327.1 PP-loop domain protein [Desulfurivibrio alkaliphilus AHT 2]
MPDLPAASPGFARLCDRLADFSGVAVAFSGGVDSSLLLAAALAVHGEQTLVLHACSPIQAPGEHQKALEMAAALGCRPTVVNIDPYSWPEFVANPADRCYRCKIRLYSIFQACVRRHGRSVLLDGTNGDDVKSDDRPGLRALQELQVGTPLADLGFSKNEVRRLAKERSLANWNKPSASCLATRIMAGQSITPERLAVVAEGEKMLAGFGFTGSRFRHYGRKCLLEVAPDDYKLLENRDFMASIESRCRELGFTVVERGTRPQTGI